ncbi:MAG: biotin transporter BioY [Clostridia bacterium]|nr:biotin transporter BioY [Clostridia bacterium]
MMGTKKLIFVALFAAITALFAQLILPLPFSPVPVNLALLSPILAGRLFGVKVALLSQLLYISLGALGLPVFAAFGGGFGVLLGPGGGFLWGYLLVAFFCGQRKFPQKNSLFADGAVMCLSVLSCYLCGSLWYAFVTKTAFLASLPLCVLPFLPGDALKIAAGLYLTRKLAPLDKKWA